MLGTQRPHRDHRPVVEWGWYLQFSVIPPGTKETDGVGPKDSEVRRGAGRGRTLLIFLQERV